MIIEREDYKLLLGFSLFSLFLWKIVKQRPRVLEPWERDFHQKFSSSSSEKSCELKMSFSFLQVSISCCFSIVNLTVLQRGMELKNESWWSFNDFQINKIPQKNETRKTMMMNGVGVRTTKTKEFYEREYLKNPQKSFRL